MGNFGILLISISSFLFYLNDSDASVTFSDTLFYDKNGLLSLEVNGYISDYVTLFDIESENFENHITVEDNSGNLKFVLSYLLGNELKSEEGKYENFMILSKKKNYEYSNFYGDVIVGYTHKKNMFTVHYLITGSVPNSSEKLFLTISIPILDKKDLMGKRKEVEEMLNSIAFYP